MATPNPPPGTPRSGVIQGKSYAGAVTQRLYTEKRSMIHSTEDTTTVTSSTTVNKVKILRTVICRHARSSNCFFLDISKGPSFTDEQYLKLISAQYEGASKFYGTKFVGKKGARYLELYPTPEILEKFKTEGLLITDAKLRILPVKAIEGKGTVIQLNLTDLPIMATDSLLTKLKQALSKFGTILDIGLHHESTMGWFMGSGYAVLQQDDKKTYPTLHHHITMGDDDYCYATFPAMPTWCRYCHEEGHTKYGCKKALANVLCFNCDQYGHKKTDCPRPTPSTNRAQHTKKPRKTPLPIVLDDTNATANAPVTGLKTTTDATAVPPNVETITHVESSVPPIASTSTTVTPSALNNNNPVSSELMNSKHAPKASVVSPGTTASSSSLIPTEDGVNQHISETFYDDDDMDDNDDDFDPQNESDDSSVDDESIADDISGDEHDELYKDLGDYLGDKPTTTDQDPISPAGSISSDSTSASVSPTVSDPSNIGLTSSTPTQYQ
ncbi:unnamed protein product [Absidia cylindrospora]